MNTRGWEKLAALIDGQAVNGFQVREAAGLLKVLVVVKSNYSYQVAARKTKEFNANVQLEVRLLLANSLDDVFA